MGIGDAAGPYEVKDLQLLPQSNLARSTLFSHQIGLAWKCHSETSSPLGPSHQEQNPRQTQQAPLTGKAKTGFIERSEKLKHSS